MAISSRGFTIPLSARREPQNRRPVLLLGDCERTPFTEAEAMEEMRKGAGRLNAGRCGACFSEDGEAFWHVIPIENNTYSVTVKRIRSTDRKD